MRASYVLERDLVSIFIATMAVQNPKFVKVAEPNIWGLVEDVAVVPQDINWQILVQAQLRKVDCVPATLKRASSCGKTAAPTHTCIECSIPLFLENCHGGVLVRCAGCPAPQPKTVDVFFPGAGTLQMEITHEIEEPGLLRDLLHRVYGPAASFVDANPKFIKNAESQWAFPAVRPLNAVVVSNQPLAPPHITPKEIVIEEDDPPLELPEDNDSDVGPKASQQKRFFFKMLKRTLESGGLQSVVHGAFNDLNEDGLTFGPSNETFDLLIRGARDVLFQNSKLADWACRMLSEAKHQATFEAARQICHKFCKSPKGLNAHVSAIQLALPKETPRKKPKDCEEAIEIRRCRAMQTPVSRKIWVHLKGTATETQRNKDNELQGLVDHARRLSGKVVESDYRVSVDRNQYSIDKEDILRDAGLTQRSKRETREGDDGDDDNNYDFGEHEEIAQKRPCIGPDPLLGEANALIQQQREAAQFFVGFGGTPP